MAHTPRAALVTVALVLNLASPLATAVAASTATDGSGAAVAVIGGKTVRREELGPELSQKLADITKSYGRRRHELEAAERSAVQDALTEASDRYVNERVLGLEASATGRSREQLLQHVTAAPVSPAELHRMYDEHAKEINRPYADVEKELKAAMEHERLDSAREAYYATLRTKYQARVLVEPARLTVTPSGPALGPDSAPVQIVLFSDFECPYCQKVMPTLREVLAKYPKDVRLSYRHLPLTGLHPHAYAAAEAAVCADRQGKFWPFADALFADRKNLGLPLYQATADKVGLGRAAFDRCVSQGESKAAVDADVNAAEELGLSGTPAMLVNGRLVAGAVPVATLNKMIDEELARR